MTDKIRRIHDVHDIVHDNVQHILHILPQQVHDMKGSHAQRSSLRPSSIATSTRCQHMKLECMMIHRSSRHVRGYLGIVEVARHALQNDGAISQGCSNLTEAQVQFGLDGT